MKKTGFTLIEIIIALFIFAILGAVATVGLHAVVRTYHHIKRSDQQLQSIQIAMVLMQRDFTQMIDRPVIDVTGEELPAFLIDGKNHIEFTRGGYINPFSFSDRSSLQRIAYEWNGNRLTRLSWSVLDRSPHSKASRRVLLASIDKMTVEFVNSKGEFVSSWSESTLPRAVDMKLKLKDGKTLERIFPITSREFFENE